MAAGTARVQSSVKSQIAYASIAQIGLMFLEISLGWKHLALFHFAGNAFLRTYQLLVSPSVVSYLIKEQFYQFSENAKTIESSYPQRWRNTFYLLCLKEWNMDLWQRKWLWGPLKKLGNQLHFLNFTRLLLLFIPLIGLISYLKDSQFLLALNPYLPVFLAALALLLVLKSFAEKRSIRLSWALVFFNHLLIALAVSFNEAYEFQETLTYLSGIFVAGLIGFITIHRLFLQEGKIRLGQFHGLAASHPKMALAFGQNASGNEALKLKLNEQGSHYFQFTFLNQTWVRWNQSNPGSLVKGPAMGMPYPCLEQARWFMPSLPIYGPAIMRTSAIAG